ncbi:hypothetical protein ILYODFUR_006679 [Ilyodon furcidens]|uniref:Uncharacterized protein n=1 Tax=Ilyodon furcidens TaxID=33524 RepID=A0ABV0UDV9_9TELE
MEREFKRGEVLVKLFTHLATSPSSPWRRLEIAGTLQDWLKARRDFFPDPRIHHTIEGERQRALGEIAVSMRRPPAPSSARLSTEAGGGFPAHGLAPDQPSPLLPTPNPVPGQVPEGSMDEPPPHPDPVPGSVPEGSQAEPPSHPVPVLESSEEELPPSLVPVPEEFVDGLSPLPVSVPEGCKDSLSLPAVPRRLRRRSPQPRRRPQRFLPLCRRPADRRTCPVTVSGPAA